MDSHTEEGERIGSIFVKSSVQISLKFLDEHTYPWTWNVTAENLNEGTRQMLRRMGVRIFTTVWFYETSEKWKLLNIGRWLGVSWEGIPGN